MKSAGTPHLHLMTGFSFRRGCGSRRSCVGFTGDDASEESSLLTAICDEINFNIPGWKKGLVMEIYAIRKHLKRLKCNGCLLYTSDAADE